ncbi:uncharacterized protein LOC141598255 isoform X2 [Silene latifolia]|uniref:uncharacterized protein LOC141598255 isoform X2 n=1 Tax=Silene latifolia TaxID=37657 RepID=UPI003D77AE95
MSIVVNHDYINIHIQPQPFPLLDLPILLATARMPLTNANHYAAQHHHVVHLLFIISSNTSLVINYRTSLALPHHLTILYHHSNTVAQTLLQSEQSIFSILKRKVHCYKHPLISNEIEDMLPGLQQGQEKMSNSEASSAIFMDDDQILYCNIGNPQSLGQHLVTFLREVSPCSL